MNENNRTIICIYGRKDEGKSSTILIFVNLLSNNFNLDTETLNFDRNEDGIPVDVWGTLTINGVTIGFESQGDPGGRMMRASTLRDLAERERCDIIICASRTEGNTVRLVDNIANNFDYHILWISSFYSPGLNSDTLNNLAAENLLQIIQQLITDDNLNRIQQQ